MGWSRSRQDERVRKLSQTNDVAVAIKELDRSRKDLAALTRPGTVDPAYLRKRELERTRAEQAAYRLGEVGVAVQLPDFAFRPPIPPPPPPPEYIPVPVPVVEVPPPPQGPSHQDVEIAALKSQVSRLSTRNHKLEIAVQAYRERRDEEKAQWEEERLKMARLVVRLKEEVEEGWSRVMRMRSDYESRDAQRATTARRSRATASGNGANAYLSEDDYDTTYKVRRQPSRSSVEDPYPPSYRPSSRMSVDNHHRWHGAGPLRMHCNGDWSDASGGEEEWVRRPSGSSGRRRSIEARAPRPSDLPNPFRGGDQEARTRPSLRAMRRASFDD